MPITSIPSNIVIPKQPKIFIFENNSAVSGTWYTAISSTNVRGIISKLTLTINLNTPAANQYLEMRITIDGVVNTFGNPTTNMGALGLVHNYLTTEYHAHQSIDYYCNITFTNSILVEFRKISVVGTHILIGNVMYSTE